MQIRIVKPGLLSTIQDMGRDLYLSQAVPVSGAMDSLSARIANKAVGNTDNEAVIEFTYADAEFIAETDLLIAYAGDGAILKVVDQKLPPERPIYIPAGTNIKLTNNPTGSRTYMAIAGGWDLPDVLGSKSTFITAGFGGLEGRSLKAGDQLTNIDKLSSIAQKIFDNLNAEHINYPNWSIPRQLLLPADRKSIRVVAANEFDWFDKQSIVDFFTIPYVIGQRSNRMGYHLEGAIINRVKKDELLSTAVTPGTIQITGNGSMVLLMADCQITGGYPRIAQVAAVDMPLCAQLKPGDAIYFKQINRDEAEMLYLERERDLQRLTTAVQYKFL
ncbi:MAG: urea amidolyase [Mucilaginibacter sp.]|uniref:5-oxoprolinase subunit C family protein n=1 Tax=Mucilaginibacter sp. TaxID=1882438 RepID=UPI00261D9C38|nr:biotin-dependent carboxyltransferase family protein [Mucilaginibacter sp.]MDB5003323.1 urea amidolyase [Mucilaginibacter sp.]